MPNRGSVSAVIWRMDGLMVAGWWTSVCRRENPLRMMVEMGGHFVFFV